MKAKILNTRWEHLIMATYEIDTEVIEEYVPQGFELDLFEGRALVSVVAFRFWKTRFFGVPMPFYNDFPEINLRIYVKGMHQGVMRRGVVFIKEIIPHHVPALIARHIFRENFHVDPVELNRYGEAELREVHYTWGDGNELGGVVTDEPKGWQKGTEEEFVGDNFWAFKKRDENRTYAFKVDHEAWKMAPLENVKINIDLEVLYDEKIANGIRRYGDQPRNIFYIDGGQVKVGLPERVAI